MRLLNSALFALGMPIAAALPFATAQGQDSSLLQQIATWHELNVPDEHAHVVLNRKAEGVGACTADNYFIVTHLFATARYRDTKGTSTAKSQADYLHGVSNALRRAVLTTKRSTYPQPNVRVGSYIGNYMPIDIEEAMNSFTRRFNAVSSIEMNWKYKGYWVSASVNERCEKTYGKK